MEHFLSHYTTLLIIVLNQLVKTFKVEPQSSKVHIYISIKEAKRIVKYHTKPQFHNERSRNWF